MEERTFKQGDNWHAHLRQDKVLAQVAPYFNVYGRVMCMGNTDPLIETPEDAARYRNEILFQGVEFEPVMTIMLTDKTTPETIIKAKEAGFKFIKFIPVGTSTGAVRGLRLFDFGPLYGIFSVIEEMGLHLLLHAELIEDTGGNEIHIIDREARAIDAVSLYQKHFPDMKITIEHVSSKEMINFVRSIENGNVSATVALQHAMFIYPQVFDRFHWCISPQKYCFPIVKWEDDREAVIEIMTSGDERFFYGADSAPHLKKYKTSFDPKPGSFFGKAESSVLLSIFDKAGAINRFEDFYSCFGAKTYNFPLNKKTITFVKEEWTTTESDDDIGFCMGGEIIQWKIKEINGGENGKL